MKKVFQIIVLILSNSLIMSVHSKNFIDPTSALKAIITTDKFKLDMAQLNLFDIDIMGADIKSNIIHVLIDEDEMELLSNNHFNIKYDYSWQLQINREKKYKSPAEIKDFLSTIANRFPQITKLISIGKSIKGRDIWALKISDNAAINETDEPSILFNSMHHAREVMTPEVAIDIITQLTSLYNNDAKTTHWVNSNQIWIVPMLNVDGNAKVWSGSSMWRKNTRGGYGVDLNRNYPTTWNTCRGSSGSKWSQTYRGHKAGSEPETQALMNLVKNIRPVFSISYHSYSEIVIYPLGCRGARTINKEIVEGIGIELANKLDYRPGTAWELLYSVDGGDIDWMYNRYQVIPYVVEVNTIREGFWPDYDIWREKTVIRNRAGWQFLLDRLDKSAIKGIVKDSRGLAINDYSIDILKKDTQNSNQYQTYSGNKGGMFHLILQPGTYDLNFKTKSAQSTITVTVKESNIIITPIL